MIKYGIVSDVKPGFVKVFLEDDDIVTDFIPVLVRKSLSDKESWQLEINEHVVCIMDERCNEGVCLGAICSSEDQPDGGESKGKFRKVFEDGTLIEYDRNTSKLTVDVKGELSAKTTGKVIIESGSDLEAKATGNAKVEAGVNLEAKALNIDATATVKATIQAVSIEITGLVTITGNCSIIGMLSAGGISTVPGAGGGTGAVNVAGDFNVTGKIESSGEIKGSDVKAGAVSLLTHKHSGVQTGAGTSGPAVP